VEVAHGAGKISHSVFAVNPVFVTC
jgi:hypothetical protein